MTSPLDELRFALAEADAEAVSDELRGRVLGTALRGRAARVPVDLPDPISGLEVFRRAVDGLDTLLAGLTDEEWRRQALRDLDVQGAVGHLIGVERQFLSALDGTPRPGDHIASTDPDAQAQLGRAPSETFSEWRELVRRTVATADAQDISFYGLSLNLDRLLVVRAFEMWIHTEDIGRATGRPLEALDAERLGRMTEVALELIRRYGGPPRPLRLVLTGRGGGTWDMADAPQTTRVVVDATSFCRIVGNRATAQSTDTLITGDIDLGSDLLAAASALALD